MSNAKSASPEGFAAYYQKLHAQCAEVLEQSLLFDGGAPLASSHAGTRDLETWTQVLTSQSVSNALSVSIREYQFGILTLTQGFYRHAFASLRLCLELALGAVYLSANELYLRLWQLGKRDISWSLLVDPEKGVFSNDFLTAFFPAFFEDAPRYGEVARKAYRECSEYVHANPQTDASLPSSISFAEQPFAAWHELAATIRLVVHFVLAARFLKDLPPAQRTEIEPVIQEQLGHLPAIQALLAITGETST